MEIGILGAGAMGSGIAQVVATAGHKVRLFDIDSTSLEKSRSDLEKILKRLQKKGRIRTEKAKAITNNIDYVTDLQALEHTQLVIEAVVENIEIKKKVFLQLESIVSEHTILASNTSSLSITALAACLEKPERFIGIHFFNPAPLMSLVEVIPAIQTEPNITSRVTRQVEEWQKVPVLAKDTPGFIVNKVARPFYGEALRLLEEGVADIASIDWALTTIGGFRMGPFELMDLIGLDVNLAATESVFQAFYYDERYRPSFTQQRYVEAGYLGKKTGRGFYKYDQNGEKQILEAVKNKSQGRAIVHRIVVMLINEAADTLYRRIASQEAIELAMTKGVNYPKGLFQWADDLGISRVVEILDALFNNYHETRYRCSPLLRKMRIDGRTFY